MVTTEQVKSLRDETGISIMQCKKALEEAGGDREKALVQLKKQSAKQAAKKADRELGSGVVQAYIHGQGKVGAMVELSSETDFVSGNDEFRALAYDIAMHIAASVPQYLTEEEIPAEEKEKAKEAFASEVADKPDDLKEKILDGKLQSYFKDKVLLTQEFVKNPEKTVGDLVQEAVQKFGERVEIRRFSRFSTAE